MEMDLVVTSGLSSEVDDNNNDTTFPVEVYTTDNSNLEGERCGICMDIIIDMGVLDCCRHLFCFVCIDNWSTITNLCPLCQSEFQLITCVPVYDTTGSNKVDEDSIPRDEDWSIEGKGSTISFPSYYIDENAVTCLDGNGCKIRHGSTSVEENQSLDTSIACDSCDVWYHAFCVGFDTDDTSEDTWLCPRCANNEVQQQHDVISMQKTNSHCIPDDANSNCLMETAFSRKVSVSIADDGETAVVVSNVDGYPSAPNSSQDLLSTYEFDNDVKPDSNSLKAETTSSQRRTAQSSLEAHELKLSLSHDASSCLPSSSLYPSQLKTSHSVKAPSESNESCSTNKLCEGETGTGLHLGLSVGSFLSGLVDGMKCDESKDQLTGDLRTLKPLEASMSKAVEIVPDANENAGRVLRRKRRLADISEDTHTISEDEETKIKNVPGVQKKKTRGDVKTEIQTDASISNEPQTCSSQILASKNNKLKKRRLEKDDATLNIMSIVKGNGHKPSKGIGQRNTADTLKESENSGGLRIKKIMRRAAEDKDSAIVVEELRKKIREAVRNKEEIGENLFDPKLLAAFRVAIAGPKTEPIKKLSGSALKVKKSMFQKGKVRENLTKKIYADANGRRKRAWQRDCNVEFWKYRCMRATKPEKIETLKSVLDLLKKNPGTSEIDKDSESQAANPILSRLYLADTSVFPRKGDIKPLSALGDSEQNKVLSSVEKTLSLDVSTLDKNSKTNLPSSKADATSTKAPLNRRPGGSGDSKGVKFNDVKIDKRKWALEILARKSALDIKKVTQDKEEDIALLKGNYPLLAQLPADMRPALAPSRHNKVPISVRQTQLYRITEHFLRKANLPVICRTAETELAVADAVNIEKEVANRSNSKVVYLNLCSQELLHCSDDRKSNRATESVSSPPAAAPAEKPEDVTDNLCSDPDALEALRTAGLLWDSPPNSPCNKTEVSGELDNDSTMKINEQDPDNIFDMDSHPEVDIYGDFEYDIEDEDFIGSSALKVMNPQPESVSKVKVLFSTFNSEKSNNVLDTKSQKDSEGAVKDATSPLKSHIDTEIKSSTLESANEKPPESLNGGEGEELSMLECEELYGPDKEPLITRFPEGASSHVVVGENSCASKVPGEENNSSNHIGMSSPNGSQTSENVPKKEKNSKVDVSKHSDGINVVSKKVEAYIKEHIRPLCITGVITTEQYRWAVAKTSDKVMKHHVRAKSANFLIKEGEKVKKLAEQYIEAAQKKKQDDHQ